MPNVLERLGAGNPGDARPLEKVFLNCALITAPVAGCNFSKRGREVVILPAGGDKTTRAADIKSALRLARNLYGGMMAITITARYDIAEHLRTPAEMAAHLEACLEEAKGDAAFIAISLDDIARRASMPF